MSTTPHCRSAIAACTRWRDATPCGCCLPKRQATRQNQTSGRSKQPAHHGNARRGNRLAPDANEWGDGRSAGGALPATLVRARVHAGEQRETPPPAARAPGQGRSSPQGGTHGSWSSSRGVSPAPAARGSGGARARRFGEQTDGESTGRRSCSSESCVLCDGLPARLRGSRCAAVPARVIAPAAVSCGPGPGRS